MNFSKQQWWTIASLILITPLGFLTKAYHGVGAHWVNDSLSGLLYVVFWCLVVYLLFPRYSVKNIAIGVFVVTSVLEVAQLWHPAFLEYLRSFYLGRVLLGTTFVWSDFVYYALGSLLAFLWMQRVANRSTKK